MINQKQADRILPAQAVSPRRAPGPNGEKRLARPSDFEKVAIEAKAEVRNGGRGDRVVVRYQGKTIGFSSHGNKEFSRPYRYLLIKAFKAAGLLAVIIVLVRLFIVHA